VNPAPNDDERRNTWLVFAFFLVAAAVRIFYVASVSDSPYVRYPMVDSRAYHEEALSILGGNWLRDGIFYQDPLYPYFLALMYALFAPGSVAVLYAQALLDSVSVVLVYTAARRIASPGVALLAGGFACFYKVMFYYDALLLKATLTLFLISLGFALLFWAGGSRRAWRFGGAGFAFGLAALTRGNYLLFFPFLLAWPWLAGASVSARRGPAAVFLAAGIALAILPVTLRNYAVGGDFVLITSQAGQNFYIGNHRGNDSGIYDAPAFVEANPIHEQEDFQREAERRTGRSLSPSALSRYWFGETFAEIRADPEHFFALLARKARIFFNDTEVPDNQSFAFFAANESAILRLPLPTFGLLLPLAALGAVFARHVAAARLLLIFVGVYAGSVILFFNLSRYRIPVLPALFILASMGTLGLAQRVRARAWNVVVPALIFLGLAFPVVFQEVTPPDFGRVRTNMAAAHEMRARDLAARDRRLEADALYDLAETEYRRALELRARNPRAQRALRQLLRERVLLHFEAGDWARAKERALTLTTTYPSDADGFALLGAILLRTGEPERAADALQRSLAIDPDNPRARQEQRRLRR